MSKTMLALPEQAPEQAPKRSLWRTFLSKYLRPAVVLTLLLTILTGLVYPGVVTGLAQLIFPYQANGSLHYVNGKLVGSDLIGQYWTLPKYFHGRPSATVNPSTGTPEPYAADNSTASNLGPTNSVLIQNVQQRVAALKKENPNAPPGPVPVDLVTSSGSGLDPDITIAGALYQVPRIAAARGLSQARVTQLVVQNETGRFLGIFGEPLYWLLSTSVLKNEKRAAFFNCSLLQLSKGLCVQFQLSAMIWIQIVKKLFFNPSVFEHARSTLLQFYVSSALQRYGNSNTHHTSSKATSHLRYFLLYLYTATVQQPI